MRLKLNVWRQRNQHAKGEFVSYDAPDVDPDMSFLEMLDTVNEKLLTSGGDPIAFDHDCREGICGMCSLVINGNPHGPERATTTCQLFMRNFQDGQVITIEPWRAGAFPVIRDLVVDRRSFDRIMQSGGFVSINTGSTPDANAIPVPKEDADLAFHAASCIGCGACVAACPNASAMLFVAAKTTQLAHLPQGHPERYKRAQCLIKRLKLTQNTVVHTRVYREVGMPISHWAYRIPSKRLWRRASRLRVPQSILTIPIHLPTKCLGLV